MTAANDTSAPLQSLTPIRDAACVIVIDDETAPNRLLMGRRHKDQIFLPDKWVFPGGRVDSGDRGPAGTDAYVVEPAIDLPAFARAALRELEEETGLRIDAIESLHPLARAITPPGRVRRYDTWFFLANRSDVVSSSGANDGELLDLAWFTLSEARHLDIPNITKLVLEDVANWMAGDRTRPLRVPFYDQQDGTYSRSLTPTPSL